MVLAKKESPWQGINGYEKAVLDEELETYYYFSGAETRASLKKYSWKMFKGIFLYYLVETVSTIQFNPLLFTYSTK